ncbi:MAG TPA: prefoldin subunit alpha [Candidatus Nanoarchaeia archaeon]|uniref:Prefoldin subunit alpha n=1 Tax=uncultured archaeon Rifle_16ft_4_minimus_37913 TaxID=1665152 RepID=A0A0H4T917_9ARCH|nr:prefoldin subunit alpha, prefoldin alpha subunit [uncultured archaeon Rifle_16ft_4_minimus_37913]HKZ33985.1 prefoldin subunit alpha [Candidatus Nanoarchaeia archaeon]
MEQEKKQELIFRLGMFEQQIHQMQEQMEAVEKGINDLGSLNFGLDELRGYVGKEILSPLGKGIFVKTKLASEDLTVDIGRRNFVKKSIPETKEIIEEQIKKLIIIKKEINGNLEKISDEMRKSLEEFKE